MSETVNAIQDRLRPGNIASNAAESVKSTVRNVASDTARPCPTARARWRTRNRSSTVRANPIPTAMIGIGIAGLTWLALGGREAQPAESIPRPFDRGIGGASPRITRASAITAAEPGTPAIPARATTRVSPASATPGFGETGYPGQGGYETAAAVTTRIWISMRRRRQLLVPAARRERIRRGNRGDYGDRSSSWTEGMATASATPRRI